MTRLLLGPLLRHVGTTDATIWVETDAPCEVEVLDHRERTWSVAGHHYALVAVEGLAPDSSTPYQVRLDGDVVWPEADSGRPAPRIRTTPGSGPIRIAFGSCRYARSSAVQGDQQFDADALVCLARSMGAAEPRTWPHALVLLGDQVYADETSPDTQRRIRRRRDINKGSGAQVADYEEYTWLYHESWTDPDVRWLLSTVPSSMIFDGSRRPGRLEHLAFLAAGHSSAALVARAHRRRAVLLLGLPASGQPVSRPARRRRALPEGPRARWRRRVAGP